MQPLFERTGSGEGDPSALFSEDLRSFLGWTCAAFGCTAEMLSDGGVHIVTRPEPRYEDDPFGGSVFRMVTFGRGTVLSVSPELVERCRAFETERADTLFGADSLWKLEKICRTCGETIETPSSHFLFSETSPCPPRPEGFVFRFYERDELDQFYREYPHPMFRNALAYSSAKDVLLLTAEKDGRVVAAAGCDDRIRSLWQVGVDTLPEYRNLGLSAFLTRRMAEECRVRGRVVFYSTWPANLASNRTALRAGFLPVNLELYSVRAGD